LCTAVHFPGEPALFGRNLDLEYHFKEQIIITPRNFPFPFRCGDTLYQHYAMIGMATVAEGYPLYYEACNEHGLAMAGLNFPGNAVYLPPEDGWDNITPFELIPYLLGNCRSVQQAKEKLGRIRLCNISFHPKLPLSPLHFILADPEYAIVLEPGNDGLHVYDDTIGVLTNNPEFPWHLQNLANYMHISPMQSENRFSSRISIQPYSSGMGAMGLPGDFSSASRFVRTAFLKLNSLGNDIGQFFHILDSAAMPKGSVVMPDGRPEITQYSCCMDLINGVYYYTTYGNRQITAVSLRQEDLDSRHMIAYPLSKGQAILLQNGTEEPI